MDFEHRMVQLKENSIVELCWYKKRNLDIAAFAEVLKVNFSLTTLDLGSTGIGNTGCREVNPAQA
jgi:hypothetical protein